MVALAVGACGVSVAPAAARTLAVKLSAPAPSLTGAPCRVSVTVDRRIRRSTALLPAQFGVEGTGGPPSPETLALLGNPNLVFDAAGIADLQAGRIDPRIVAVLGSVAQGHVLTVSSLGTGYSKFTPGGAVSNHYLGRGVDIARIDGVPVNPANATARDVAAGVASLDRSYRPDEVGTPS